MNSATEMYKFSELYQVLQAGRLLGFANNEFEVSLLTNEQLIALHQRSFKFDVRAKGQSG